MMFRAAISREQPGHVASSRSKLASFERESLKHEGELLSNLKAALPALRLLMKRVSGRGYEDAVYRFYHQSLKVYGWQRDTLLAVELLQSLTPGRVLNASFRQIVAEGTGKKFEPPHNQRWFQETRPIVEAFLHARFFLEMAVKYGEELDSPPEILPFGWAALLHLYDLR